MASAAPRKALVASALACILGCAMHLAVTAGCGREDIPLDPDDDGGEDGEAPGDAGTSDAPVDHSSRAPR